MAARTRRVNMHQAWREKIKASMLINRLQDHAIGKIELSQTQVNAINILLKKVAPDLSAVEHSGDINVNDASELGRDEIIDRIRRIEIAKGTAGTRRRKAEPDPVH